MQCGKILSPNTSVFSVPEERLRHIMHKQVKERRRGESDEIGPKRSSINRRAERNPYFAFKTRRGGTSCI